MVRELEIGLRPDSGHVAGDTGGFRGIGCGTVPRAGVTGGADFAVSRGVTAHFAVWSMAGKARQLALAFAEAGTFGKIQRLVARVPGIGPIGVVAGCGRLAVTAAAELIDGVGGEPPGIAHGRLFGSVRGGGAVTGFALHAGFGRQDAIARSQLQGSGGVALETAQNGRVGIEGAIDLTTLLTMAWSDFHAPGGGIPTEAVFEVVFVVAAADKGDGLRTGSEGPIGLDLRKAVI